MRSEMCKLSIECTQEQGEISAGDQQGVFDVPQKLTLYCFFFTGSYVAAPCPLGTYSNTSGAVNDYDCTDCDQGYYCSSVAGGAPTGQCWGGHFCNGSAKVPYQWETDPGNIFHFPKF